MFALTHIILGTSWYMKLGCVKVMEAGVVLMVCVGKVMLYANNYYR